MTSPFTTDLNTMLLADIEGDDTVYIAHIDLRAAVTDQFTIGETSCLCTKQDLIDDFRQTVEDLFDEMKWKLVRKFEATLDETDIP